MKIIFLGTHEFGAAILEGLVKNNYKPCLVITGADKPVGRKKVLTPMPVKIIAKKHNITFEEPGKIEQVSDKISGLKPDLIISAGYGRIIPDKILREPKFGVLNVHPSLLPKHRGPSPVQTAILQGDKTTGITIFLMDEKIDHGKIISQIRYKIGKKATTASLTRDLAKLAIGLLVKTIPKWLGSEIKPIPQSETKASYTKIIKKEDGKIIWKKPAKEIEGALRAFNPWPGSFTFWKKSDNKILRLKILQAEIKKTKVKKNTAGKIILSDKNEVLVFCGKDALEIKKLQLEGKKPLSSQEFLRGFPDFAGAILS